jgi:hypothetical protein
MGGEECGTAPIWVLPFRVIRFLFQSGWDTAWLTELFPHLERFVQWWLDHRRDDSGRFFCNNSWESGQDGSERFLLGPGEEGKEAEFVQTVDVEAAMADAMLTLADLAPFAGAGERAARWRRLGEEVAETTRNMFVDGWFRDFDARSGKPIILPEYKDVMMLLPLAVNIATPEQTAQIRPHFQYFRDHPKHWLEWPSFLFCYTEAGWSAGLREEMAEVVAATADRVYARTHGEAVPVGEHPAQMPDPYNYRIPGTSNEYWPLEPATLAQCGSEAYGWGATLPTLILRNILGLREGMIAPVLPESLRRPGAKYVVRNLFVDGKRADVEISVSASAEVQVNVL